jgi:asparagine synthase (glutamine-hydrolysing)
LIKEYKYEFHEIIDALLVSYREASCVAFSGGVDSSLLASLARQKFNHITLLSIQFSGLGEEKFTRKAAEYLKSPLLMKNINLNELEEGIKETLVNIQYERVALLENGIGYYFIFKYASEYGFNYVLSANGIDELFCGYDIYRRKYRKNNLGRLINETTNTAIKDKIQIDKLGKLFGVKYICPFLSPDFIKFSRKIPLTLKIKDDKDVLRKHFIRKMAEKEGLPANIVYRRKRALQYSSGLHKSIKKLARSKGFTNQKGKSLGHESGVKAYIKTLQR